MLLKALIEKGNDQSYSCKKVQRLPQCHSIVKVVQLIMEGLFFTLSTLHHTYFEV